MDELKQLTNAYCNSLKEFEMFMSDEDCCEFHKVDSFGRGEGRIVYGDNLNYMAHLLKKCCMAGKIQLIYIDPPFFAREKFMSSIRLESEKLGTSPVIKIGAYDDYSGRSLEEYLQALSLRLMVMRELLADCGLIWLHLDRRVTHYARILMDMIYGQENFVNEIIWTYKSGGAGKKCFAQKHDNILVYSKSVHHKFNVLKEKSYNRDMKPYRFKGVEEFRDQMGWYTMVNMKDVWNIDMVGRTSAERQGYATQKPEKLMERIIESCSDEGDICADFYSGSGAFPAVCDRLGRKWISCDRNSGALNGQISRMCQSEPGFDVVSEYEWPQGDVVIDEGRITGYSAPLDYVECSDSETLRRYMDEDGLSFLRMCRWWHDDGGEYVSGYDFIGNMFKKYI